MTSHDDQALVRRFIMDLMSAIIEQPDRGSPSLKKWVESAVKAKIINDLPLVYPRGSQDAPNYIFLSGGDFLYLIHHRTVVRWRTASVNEISYHRAFGTVPDQELDLLRLARKEVDANTFFSVYIPYDSNKISDIWVSLVHSGDSSENTIKRTALVRDVTHLTVTRKSARNQQKALGPSDLSSPCDLCVARKIAIVCGIPEQSAPGTSFSLKAWIGTSIHQKLERDLPLVYPLGDRKDPNFYQEVTARIGEVPGLGTVRGHLDLLLPKRALVVDYKTADLYRINKYKTQGVPSSHSGQTMLYLRGVRNSGRPARTAALVYIPRDSVRISDIWVATCSYQEHVAAGLLNRAQNLVEVVRSGQTGGLASDPDCYVCHVQHRIRH